MAATRECRPLYSNRRYSNALVVYATVDNSRALRKRNAGNVISLAMSRFRNSNFAFWRVDTHLASGLRPGVMFGRLLLFQFDCVQRRYSLRSVDILTCAADKVSVSRRPLS